MNCIKCGNKLKLFGNYGSDVSPLCYDCSQKLIENQTIVSTSFETRSPKPNANEFPDSWQSKEAGKKAAGIPIALMFVLQIPFIGMYISILKGRISECWLYLLFDMLIITIFIFLSKLYGRIKFGYTVEYVYYQGLTTTRMISWKELCAIRKIREHRTWSAVDIADEDKIYNYESRFTYALDSYNSKSIYVQKYFEEATYFANAVAAKSGIEIDYSSVKKGIFEGLKSSVT